MTKMSGPTPGPWRLAAYPDGRGGERLHRDNDGSFIVLSGENEDTRQVAIVKFRGKAKRGSGGQTPDAEGEANARLISAAPKMLAALRQILAYADTSTDPGIINVARAAIAKTLNTTEG